MLNIHVTLTADGHISHAQSTRCKAIALTVHQEQVATAAYYAREQSSILFTMLTSVPQLTSRARSLQTRQSAVRILGASNAVLIRHRQQQTRGFRFGMWSSYLDPDYNREIRRRHRMLKHKCADTLNRRMSWEKHPMAEDARVALKRMVNHYWTSRDARPGGRFVNVEGFKSYTPENKAGVRPGQNIEDVERGAMEHLFFRSKPGRQDYEYDYWSTPFQNIRKYWAQQHSSPAPKKEVFRTTYRSDGSQSSELHRDYVIDPITNRKVARHPAPDVPKDGAESPAKTFKDYRSKFSSSAASTAQEQAPIFYDGPPPAEELRRYRNVKIDHRSEDNDAASQPVIQSEAYVLEHSAESTATGSKATTFTGFTHGGVSWHSDATVASQSLSPSAKNSKEVDTLFQSWSASADTPKYNDLHKYRPFGDTEVAAAENTAPKYEDLGEYKPVLDEEPASVEESQPQYEDLDQYKPVMVKETEITEEAEPKYEDLDKYTPVMVEETSVEESTPQYEDLDKYTPVMVNETTIEESEQPYEDLDKYKPVLVNEPDGKPIGYRETEPAPPELHKYEAIWYNEPDGKPLDYAEPGVDAAELSQYTAVRYNEPDGKPLSTEEQIVDSAELSRYGAVMWNEPDGQPITSEKYSETPTQSELGQYTAVRWSEPDGKPATPEQAVEDTAELGKYEAVEYQEPDGKPLSQSCPVQAALQEVDAKNDYNAPQFFGSPALDQADESSHEIMKKLNKLSFDATEAEKAEDLDLLRASDIRSASSAKTYAPKNENQEEKTHYRKMLDSLMSRHEITSDAADLEAISAIKSTKARLQAQESKRSLTGNYVRDFPEEFQKTWATVPESFEAASSLKLESALDRQTSSKSKMTRRGRRQASTDPYSTEPQGLETSYAEECDGKPTWPTFIKTYGSADASAEPAKVVMAEDSAEKAAAASPKFVEEELAEYTTLVYIPSIKRVEVSKMTCKPIDMTQYKDKLLPPPEALLRLSNSSEYIPYLAKLQAEGFEIESGHEKGLLFRKVRPSLPQAEFLPTSASAEPARANYTPVNPIDMTGSPRHISSASPNFGTPNGFTTFGPVSDLTTPQQARFQSNIEVRRTEPVFSGPKDESRSKGKKSGMGKRLIVGATWVAGVSYALGVVGEYFTTGGIDGKGPTGF